MTLRLLTKRFNNFANGLHITSQTLSAQQVSHAVITAAMKVHTELGAGLLESAYAVCLQYELQIAGYNSALQVGLPVVYREVKLELGYRMDLVVEDLVVVEIKSVEAISNLCIRRK